MKRLEIKEIENIKGGLKCGTIGILWVFSHLSQSTIISTSLYDCAASYCMNS